MQRRAQAILVIAAALLLVPLVAGPASAATITVNTTDDTVANDGVCSLREAITAANTNTASGAMAGECAAGDAAPAVDTIAFAIPGDGPHDIQPGSGLPGIIEPAVIDGYTEPGASPNTLATGSNAVLMIELDGQNAGDVEALSISAGGSTVRGLAINRFGEGILLTSSGGNVIEGNFLGTDVTGETDLGNGDHGVNVSDVDDNTIGGSTPGARNVISGNDQSGVIIQDTATGNLVEGNLIGTDADGDTALGNSFSGVTIFQGPSNTIAGNVLSSNGSDGVTIIRPEASGNLVQGNLIGTNATGGGDLGNGLNGVFVYRAPDSTIGGTQAGEGNTIANSAENGVTVSEASTPGEAAGNSILGNSIFDNDGLGIDLGGGILGTGDGVTANDANDADAGPNDLQNFPDLLWAVGGGSTTVAGSLSSEPGATYRVELFSSPDADPSGNGEGMTFLGARRVTTDGAGNVSFMITVAADVPIGDVVTATATQMVGNATSSTSEFSEALPFPSPCTVAGTLGDDVLQGTPADDVICGLGGDDLLLGGGGLDALIGGPGNDTASYAGAAFRVTANLGSGRAPVDGDGGIDLLLDIENLVGSRKADVLRGDAGGNRLVGRSGPDLLAGKGGPDVLNSGRGNDTVRGQKGKDVLRGQRGHDTLRGQKGNDRSLGGRGNDRINGGPGNRDRCRQGPGGGRINNCER